MTWVARDESDMQEMRAEKGAHGGRDMRSVRERGRTCGKCTLVRRATRASSARGNKRLFLHAHPSLVYILNAPLSAASIITSDSVPFIKAGAITEGSAFVSLTVIFLN